MCGDISSVVLYMKELHFYHLHIYLELKMLGKNLLNKANTLETKPFCNIFIALLLFYYF